MSRIFRRAKELEERKIELNEQLDKIRQGGFRERSGRKRIGQTKKVSVTLPHGDWELVDEVRKNVSQSEYIRELIIKDLKERGLKRF